MVACLSCTVSTPCRRTPFLSSRCRTNKPKFGSQEALILIQKCSNFTHLKLIHAKIIRNDLSYDQLLVRKLLHLCFSYGKMDYATLLFHRIPHPRTFTWNFTIRAYTHNGCSQQALLLYNLMICRGFSPDKFTFPFVVKACLASFALDKGKEVHGFAIKTGFWKDTFLHNTLMDIYFKCGMWIMGVKCLTKCVYVALSRGPLSLLDLLLAGNWMLLVGLSTNANEKSLIDMYSKCGSLENAKQVFDQMPIKSLATWNSMITSLGVHGWGKEALAVFAKMEEANVQPDAITFVGVLCACVQINNVEEGGRYFKYMKECYGITPVLEHYTCMVELYTRANMLSEASELVNSMPMKLNDSAEAVLIWPSIIDGMAEKDRFFEHHGKDLYCFETATCQLSQNQFWCFKWDVG
ncbi:hypothetical protein GH714_028830 [Hevea brasiliensis]|uniref:Pentacotripeptide-repeat region of PRORP domain-containing protein n=1 Tax=Hevea brasiliensis TaxID=3981 RepID=A0A6A6LJY2_HEVBR|nr:hypothetical protein GH714_028830 [Hevea brasiliensis]